MGGMSTLMHARLQTRMTEIPGVHFNVYTPFPVEILSALTRLAKKRDSSECDFSSARGRVGARGEERTCGAVWVGRSAEMAAVSGAEALRTGMVAHAREELERVVNAVERQRAEVGQHAWGKRVDGVARGERRAEGSRSQGHGVGDEPPGRSRADHAHITRTRTHCAAAPHHLAHQPPPQQLQPHRHPPQPHRTHAHAPMTKPSNTASASASASDVSSKPDAASPPPHSPVARWPGSHVAVPVLPPWGLLAIALGGLWLCLWRRPWRLPWW